MDKKKFYKNTAYVSALVGVGMILGHNLSNGATNNGLWVGGILILLGAVMFGMSVSSPQKSNEETGSDRED